MADCDWAILCDHGFQDINNKACLIGIFDRIQTVSVPAGIPRACFVANILGNSGEQCRVRIELARESGPPLFTVDVPVILSTSGSYNVFANLIGLVIPEYGSYSFNVSVNDALSKAITLVVETPPRTTT
jgi:hypothetical protein